MFSLFFILNKHRCYGAEVLLLGSWMEKEPCTDVIVLYLLLINFQVLGWLTELCSKCVADYISQYFYSGWGCSP